MDIYREHILDHFRNPRNYGSLSNATAFSEEANYSCGDSIRIEIQIKEVKKKKIVSDIRFTGGGCAISLAAASLLTEYVKGKSLEEIMKIKPDTMYEMLHVQLTSSRTKCALLSLEVLQKAVMHELS